MLFRKIKLVALSLFGALTASAQIVALTGPIAAGSGLGTAPNQQMGAVQFTTPALVNGTIIVTLNGEGDETVTAWLTNQTGPGTNAGNVVATQTFVAGIAGDGAYVAFNGLNIPAGTYYLVLEAVGQSNGVGWDYTHSPTVTGSGTYGASLTANVPPPVPFGPAATFGPAQVNFLFEVVNGTSVLPQFAFGGGWYSAIYFSNPTGAAVSFPVNFLSETGTPLNVPSVAGSTATVNLAAGGTAIIEAPNAGSLSQGSVVFSLPAGVVGYGLFQQSVPGVADQEAVVLFSNSSATSSTLIWDDTKYTTSVAIVNPSSVPTIVAITLLDPNGAMVGSSSLNLPANSAKAATLRSLPGLSGMAGQRGSAQFTVVTGNACVLGLRFDGLAFTSIPTAPGAYSN